jgi:hypothetical protein
VAPLTDKYAVVIGDLRATLADLVDDIFRTKVQAGRRAFVLCYAKPRLIIGYGDTVWVEYEEDEVKKVEAYRMSTYESVDDQMPRITFSQHKDGITVVADLVPIRTLVWLGRMGNSCLDVHGSVSY